MKFWSNKLSNMLTLLILAFVLYRQAPIWLSNSKQEGTTIKDGIYNTITAQASNEQVKFPPQGRAIAIFWATWCGPCKIEMNRLKQSVDDKKIQSSQIFAINPFEGTETIQKFLAENSYPFTFIDAPEISSKLKIEATPTTLFIENAKVHGLKTGMSIIGIWNAENFLRL